MIKKLLAGLGIGTSTGASAAAPQLHKPFADPHVNFIYNLLFCDDISLYKLESAKANGEPWATLLADKPSLEALQSIADDHLLEGRMRTLAYNRIRASGRHVPPKKLFGVIVEVPQPKGLDVLAAFSEGGVRYLNQSGKIAVFEGEGHPVEHLAKELVAISQPVVNRIGPWEQSRLPPPKTGNVRLTFLVSDGLYFGEGPFGALQRDSLAGPVLAKAAQLLQASVEAALK